MRSRGLILTSSRSDIIILRYKDAGVFGPITAKGLAISANPFATLLTNNQIIKLMQKQLFKPVGGIKI